MRALLTSSSVSAIMSSIVGYWEEGRGERRGKGEEGRRGESGGGGDVSQMRHTQLFPVTRPDLVSSVGARNVPPATIPIPV